MKTLYNSNISDAKINVADLKIIGNGNMFSLLCKASSQKEGWMKSTKAMEIPWVGCLVQVTTQQGDNVAEALCFVPGVKIVPERNGNGRKLEAIYMVKQEKLETISMTKEVKIKDTEDSCMVGAIKDLLINDEMIDQAIDKIIEIYIAVKKNHPAMQAIIKCLIYDELNKRMDMYGKQ